MAQPVAIQSLLPVATSELQTKEKPASTPASAEFNLQRFDERFRGIFDAFQTLDDPQLSEMKLAARAFCLAMSRGTKPYWLSLLGTSGAGKTMLAQLCTRFFNRYVEGRPDEIRSGPQARYIRTGGMLRWHRCLQAMIEERDYGFLRQAREDWFLAVDDIGAEYGKHRELSSSKLYDIFSEREGRFTILTANLTLDKIGEYLEARLASRLIRHGSQVVDVDIQDFNTREVR